MKVVRAAGWESHNEAHRPGRIPLRPCDPQQGRQRGSARGQTQKSTAGKFHRRTSVSRCLTRSPRAVPGWETSSNLQVALRRKLLTLAREWMHAAMHQQGAEI